METNKDLLQQITQLRQENADLREQDKSYQKTIQSLTRQLEKAHDATLKANEQAQLITERLSVSIANAEKLTIEIREEYKNHISKLQADRDHFQIELGRCLTSIKGKDDVIKSKDVLLEKIFNQNSTVNKIDIHK